MDRAVVKKDAINWLASLIGEFQQCQNALSARVDGLLMPEGLAWAVHYLHSLLSGRLFLNQQRFTADSVVHEYLQLQSSCPYSFASYLYPRLYPLTLDIYEQEPLPGDYL
jgi:hypothetical protein